MPVELDFAKEYQAKTGKRLPAKWVRHLKRIDALPVMKKPLTARQIAELAGA